MAPKKSAPKATLKSSAVKALTKAAAKMTEKLVSKVSGKPASKPVKLSAKKDVKPSPAQTKGAKNTKGVGKAMTANAKVQPTPPAAKKVAGKTDVKAAAGKVELKVKAGAKGAVEKLNAKDLAKANAAAAKASAAVAAPVPVLTKAQKKAAAAAAAKAAYDLEACREVSCESQSTTAGYCRLHYIKNWKKIKRKELILREKKLNQYIEELVAKYPDKYIEAIKMDLADEKAFSKVIYDLELDESVDDIDVDAENDDQVLDTIKRGGFDDSGDSDF